MYMVTLYKYAFSSIVKSGDHHMGSHIPKPTTYTITILPLNGSRVQGMLHDKSMLALTLRGLAEHDAFTTHIILCGSYRTESEQGKLLAYNEKIQSYLTQRDRPDDMPGPHFNQGNIHNIIIEGSGPTEIKCTFEAVYGIWSRLKCHDQPIDIFLSARKSRWALWKSHFEYLSKQHPLDQSIMPTLRHLHELNEWMGKEKEEVAV